MMRMVIAAMCMVTYASTIAQERVLIPFANERIPKEQWQLEGGDFSNEEIDEARKTITITGVNVPLGVHLIKSHKCPAWVVEIYKDDPENLDRIHRGYESHGFVQRFRKEIEEANAIPDKEWFYSVSRSEFARITASQIPYYARQYTLLEVVQKKEVPKKQDQKKHNVIKLTKEM